MPVDFDAQGGVHVLLRTADAKIAGVVDPYKAPVMISLSSYYLQYLYIPFLGELE